MNIRRNSFDELCMAPRQRGVTMVEVLIAVFVLAVGLLGTATLQVTSKRGNLEARDRVLTTVIAQGFIERMRMNPRALGVYTDSGLGRTLDGAGMAAVDCSVECTEAQVAALDLYDLEQALAGAAEQLGGTAVGGLSSPRVCIDGPDGGSGTYTVAIAWRGLTRLSDPGLHACGQGSGDYDTADGTQADVYRRVLLLDTYIAVPS
jgi:type IV pilus assembly protein PilV